MVGIHIGNNHGSHYVIFLIITFEMNNNYPVFVRESVYSTRFTTVLVLFTIYNYIYLIIINLYAYTVILTANKLNNLCIIPRLIGLICEILLRARH